MGFGNIFDSVRLYFSSSYQKKALDESFDLFKKDLNGEENPIIRVWVADSDVDGHMANTVNIIYQLANSADVNGFEYAGTIEVYYKSADNLEKLYELLPSLNSSPDGKVNQATVKLIEYKETPDTAVNLGFSGADDTGDDLATQLNCNYFLLLQPYMWQGAEELQLLSAPGNPIDLATQQLLNKGAFKQRGYWLNIEETPDWDYYTKNGYASQVAVIQDLISNIDKYDLGVTYNIGDPSELRSTPQERMFEVITGYLASQMDGASPAKGAKPIVVLSMDNFKDGAGGAQTTLKGLIQGQRTAAENAFNTEQKETDDQKRKNELLQLLKPAGYRKTYLNGKDVVASTRVEYVWKPTLQNVTSKYAFLDEAKNRLLFVQLGPVPAEIFNYVVNKATMPLVFEAQNTGNIAAQTGKPYFHISKQSASTVQYPTTLLGYSSLESVPVRKWEKFVPTIDYVPGIVYKMQDIANQLNFPLDEWPSTAADSPAEIIGSFIKDYTETAGAAYKAYYDAAGEFYHDYINDKFRTGVSFLGYVLQSKEDNALSKLLGKLYDNFKEDEKTLNMFPGVYNAGPIFDFISGLLGVNVLFTEATITPDKDTENPTEIVVTGNNSQLDGISMGFTITFTAPQESIVSDWKMVYTGDWLTAQLPWLQFKEPYVLLTVANTVVPAQGGVGGRLGGLDLDLSIRMPIEKGVWQLEGHFDKPQSISNFYQMAGGVNLVQALPSPFSAIAAIGVTDCQMAYDTAGNTIQYVSFVAATDQPVELMKEPRLSMDSIVFNMLITDPGSITDRKTKWGITGKFTIGTGDDAGVITTSMNYPGPVLSGQLASGVIKVADLFKLFLPGTSYDFGSNLPIITDFQASFDGTSGNYSVLANMNFNWTFQIVTGAPTVTLNTVGVNVQKQESKLSGGLSGGFTFGSGDTAFSISLSANYDSTLGWVFAGQQTEDSVLSLTALANQLLPTSWQIPADYNYELKNFNFNFKQAKSYYEIGAETADYWKIPFIPDLKVRADLKFGYGLYEADGGDSSAKLSLVEYSGQLVAVAEEDKPGYYCTLNADVEWIGIKMKLFYNYNPETLSFGFTWGVLTGIISEETVEGTKHWIGTLKFTESVTLGSIIEEAISWATGYKYGLSSPFDLLNSLSLSALELIYDFTAKTVSFKLNIGEINLGFCKITAIGVNYQSGKPNKDDNGVFITIDGSFFWLIGSDPKDGQSDKQLNWDAAKPENTPAPSGQGNKYFDLRLLALGQHVTIPGFANVTSVQEAIKAMADLPDTEPNEIPAIIFDPNSSWLVGMDFGVLKLGGDDPDKKTDALMATADDDDETGYFIDLQIVFNDPNLYALRIALSGAPARIFKGLDFQILYRKISDSIGVYQAQIALPDVMRKIQLGTVNITLPVFGIEVYTNGDFLVDLGFPKNADFSRSFTLQVIIYVPFPIPLMGSAGLYFGKKSSATSTEVPVIDNGTFNPVLVFGVGIQFGLGYDFNAGILAAGFSLTFVTIIEGVLAKFNPYQVQNTTTGEQSDIAPSYYYSIKGVVGIQGKLYGYIDFKIIKAEVNIFLSVLADITITAYQPILLGLTARVSVSVSIRISLGFFTIKISFSFDMTIRQSYEIKVGGGASPWHIVQKNAPQGLLKTDGHVAGARSSFKMYSMSFLATVQDNFTDTPVWSNLAEATSKAELYAYLGLGLSMAGDMATALAGQQAVYSAMLFIESVVPVSKVADSEAVNVQVVATDTSFEILAKQIFRWVIAAFHNGAISAADVDKLAISEVRLQEIYEYLNNPDNNNPVPVDDIDRFMAKQVKMKVSHPSDNTGEANATFFPIVPQLSISLPAFDQQPALSYSFDLFNSLSDTYIHDLRTYFDELTVQMQKEQQGNTLMAKAAVPNETESLGTFIFADYFLLIARQMVQNAQNSLKAFHYQLVSNQTNQQIIDWINTNGQLEGVYAYTITELFNNNKSHVLNAAKPVKVKGATYSSVSDDTFNSISAKAAYNNGFTGNALATVNAANTLILQSGIVITYATNSLIIQAGNTLQSLATDFKVSLSDLLANATIANVNVLAAPGLLMPSSKLTLPDFTAQTQAADTLVTFSARYGVTIDTLAQAPENAAIADLFDIKDNSGQLIISDLPQFGVGELIKEIQLDNGLQQLSGMASRYYLSGLRLPTKGITPKYQGMWVDENMQYEENTAGLFALTGQQFPLPVLQKDGSYIISFTIPTSLTWMEFVPDGSPLDITLKFDSDNYAQIDTVRKYAQGQYLDLAIDQLGLGDMFSGSYGHYSFSTVALWQAGSPLLLPYGGVNDSQTLNIWTLPNDLISLADPVGRAIVPRFQVQIGTIDPATQAMKATPVTNYGWGTQVTFTVKKVPLSADSPASATTYEISGADGNNALILEKMVTYIGNNDSAIYQMAFGYAPNQSNGSNPGIQTDPIGSLTIGIAQANLSTFTRPDGGALKAFATTLQQQAEESNLLNTPTALITLLWQASITRDGGYFLYYYNTENGEGLPEHAFNDKGEAALSLITIYTAPQDKNNQDLLQPYLNMFVTGDPVNASDSSIYAQANPVIHPAAFGSGDTLSGLSFQYFTNIGDAIEANPGKPLTGGLDIDVPEGTYQVTNALGESLQSIADKFKTSPDAIKSANPVVTSWPDPLPLYTGLRLPPLTVKSASDANTGTLDAIAAFYRMDLTALANYNRDVPGLFVTGTSFNMTGGPVTRVATVPAGVVSLEAIRKKPDDVPAKPTDKDYAQLFLQHNFSILTFNLIDNYWFKASNPSLPAGPTDSQADPNNPYANSSDLSDKWVFKQSVPYYKFANQGGLKSTGLPDISTSPYKGIGYLVQADFTWLDIYGNTVLTTLSQPPVAGGVVNEAPILTGYTDALLGINQWPSVSTEWQMADEGQKKVEVLMSFDTSQYNGLLSATPSNATTVVLNFTEALDPVTAALTVNYKLTPDLAVTAASLGQGNKTVTLTVAAMAEDLEYTIAIGNIQNVAKKVTFNGQATYSYPEVAETASSSIVQQAQHDFQVYTQLWYQLTDPSGIEITMETSLFKDPFKLDSNSFNDLVNNWIAPIYLYLQDRSQGGTAVAAPPAAHTLNFNIDPTKVIDEQILEIVLSLAIERTGGAVMGDFETTGGVKKVTTVLSPASNSDSEVSRGLDEFADSFEKVMSVADKYYLKVSTGADRDKLGQQTPDGTIWAVRLGINNSEAIAYQVVTPGQPNLFAPKPVSNKLESRTGVGIYNYNTGTGINFDGDPSYLKDFTEIDLDQWVGSFFGSMDNILTPEFTASIQIVDKKLNTTYLKNIQDNKQALAEIAKFLMVAVFQGETADPTSVQEALKQALLVKLTNLYATNSGIQFDVKVKADKSDGTSPNLYGGFMQNTVFEGAVTKEEHLTQVTLYFSAPLDAVSANNTANYTLTSPIQVQTATLSTDGKSVALVVSENVTITITTVTIGTALLDANQRPLQGEKQYKIETGYVSYSKPDQLTITSAKIKLDDSTDQSLAFLLTTPEIVRGQDGEVLSKIDLNLSYKATDIEHQIAAPINGYTPSSWLSFVLPGVRVPLESQLGGFPVPMFLRSFPQNPTLDNQSGVAPNTEDSDISKLLKWDYAFDYSQSFHYPQDILYFTVNFNVGDMAAKGLMAIADAFNELAEFITVYPSVNTDLLAFVTKIDAKKYYDTSPEATELFKNAGMALLSFVKMVQRIVTTASQSKGFDMRSPRKLLVSTAAAAYSFEIREGAQSLNGKQVQVVSVFGEPPAGVGTPKVFIDPKTYDMEIWEGPKKGISTAFISYYYIDKTSKEPLLSSIAQNIKQREVVLPALNILQRQDAMTTVYLTRNEDLIDGQTTNPDFVYTTGDLSFANPYLPTINSLQKIELANLPNNAGVPTTRTLFNQLKTMMAALLTDNTEPSLSFQMTCSYDYSINELLSPVNLPVIMQTMIAVTLATELDPMLQAWSDGITNWLKTNDPSTVNGTLKFDLIIFSNLTKQPYPLIWLTGLQLSLTYISA